GLAHGVAHRRRLRRPEPGLRLPADRGVRIVSHASFPPEAATGPGGLWIDAQPRPGWQNMAIDHAMFDWAEATGGQLWRLYRWDPHCLSFGRHEPAARRYDRARIDQLGIDCVRRRYPA